MPYQSQTTISIRTRTRDEIKHLKRGGESYDELLQKMAEQYDPRDAPEDHA